MSSPQRMLLKRSGCASPRPRVHYIQYPFEVPERARRVTATLCYYRDGLAQLDLALFDPNNFRGIRMPKINATGEIGLNLWVGTADASPGGIPGPIPPGRWRAQIDLDHITDLIQYSLTVTAEFDGEEKPFIFEYPEAYVSRAVPGWYKGELHAHSWESDGELPAHEVVSAARQYGLNFLALTDHNTISSWRFLKDLLSTDIALIRAEELTAHGGHANLLGIKRWVNPYVDAAGWDMTQAMHEVHAQGGLFCVDHPFSNQWGWQYHHFAWDEVDLIEIYHNLEGPNNWLGLPFWDHHLNLGRRIIGVGATDSHHTHRGRHRLGQVVTWVYAPELSELGVIQGLKSGRVYISRGPEIEFSAHTRDAPHRIAYMGGKLPIGKAIDFHIEVRRVQEPLLLFILKNGLYFDLKELGEVGKDYNIEFTDTPDSPAYYRIELHAVPGNEGERELRRRSYTTVRVLSNPIFVGAWSARGGV